MNRNVLLVAETGSDLTPQMANKIGAYLVPMHVSMGQGVVVREVARVLEENPRHDGGRGRRRGRAHP